MRREALHLRRWLFNLAATVSLALGVATALLWTRSYDQADAFGSRVEHSPLLAQARGSMVLGLGSFEDEEPGHHRSLPIDGIDGIEQLAYLYVYGTDYAWSAGGHGFYVATSVPLGDAGLRNWCVVCPHWAVAGLTAVLPAVAALRAWRGRRRRRRRAACRCAVCGYDLRATPNRCPECGAVPGPAQPAA